VVEQPEDFGSMNIHRDSIMTAHMFTVLSRVATAAIVVEIVVIVKVLRGIFNRHSRHRTRASW
jgi:hypothetical protein